MADRDFYNLQLSMSKALNGMELPLKMKHARAVIISTFNNQGGHVFWTIAIRQPIMDNAISAWKFCILLHKILREGHDLCSQHSVRNKRYILDMGKFYVITKTLPLNIFYRSLIQISLFIELP